MTVLPDGPSLGPRDRWHFESEAVEDWSGTDDLDLTQRLLEWDGLPYKVTFHPADPELEDVIPAPYSWSPHPSLSAAERNPSMLR